MKRYSSIAVALVSVALLSGCKSFEQLGTVVQPYGLCFASQDVESIQGRFWRLRKGMSRDDVSTALGVDLAQVPCTVTGNGPFTYTYALFTRSEPGAPVKNTHNLVVVYGFTTNFNRYMFQSAKVVDLSKQ